MTWTKIDDQLHAHPKVMRAWEAHPRALGLHLLALSHCAAYLTDGHVSETFVKRQIHTPAGRRAAVNALVDAGLWECNESGWVIHDYLDFNESREHVQARREADSVRRASARNPDGREASRTRAGARGPTPTPFPNSIGGGGSYAADAERKGSS
jgi:hypothetical protein